MLKVGYKESLFSAFRDEHDGTVSGGERRSVPWTFDADRQVVACPMCAGTHTQQWFEAWSLNLGPEEETLVAAVGDGLRGEEFDYSPARARFCPDCGYWIVEQWIAGEDDRRYVIQSAGVMQRYSNPDDLPMEDLGRHLRMGCVRLRDTSPSTIERLAGEYLKSEWSDCEVHHVGSSGGKGDGGIDLIAIESDREFLVQVKHHPGVLGRGGDGREGVKAIRELNGALFREGKARGVFVTTAASYTRGARTEVELTKQTNPRYEMVLIDRLDLNRWLARGPISHELPWRAQMCPGPYRHWTLKDWTHGWNTKGGNTVPDFG